MSGADGSTRDGLIAPLLVSLWLATPCHAQIMFAQENSIPAVPSGAKSHESAKATLIGDGDLVVLGAVVNATSEATFDDAVKQALEIDLAQSPFLNVLSERRVVEALRTMGRSPGDPSTSEIDRELCQHTSAKIVIRGSISGEIGHYRLTLSATACTTGEMLAKEQAEATGQFDMLKTVSRASTELRRDLGESQSSLKSFDVPIDVTTASLEALRQYSRGIAVRRDKGDSPSLPLFRRAIENDPRFPLPYAELAAIYRNLRQPSLALEYATKGYQLRDRVGEREKFKLSGTYFLATGSLEREIHNYEQWQSRYPRDFVPFNNLGNDYAAIGQLEKALGEYSQAVAIAPSVITYTNVAGMELSLNHLDSADAALDAAFAQKLDGRYLHQTRYWIAFLRADITQMQQQVAWASGKSGDEDALLSMQSDTEAYYGRISNAREVTERAVQSAILVGSKEAAALWEVNAALREAEIGNRGVGKEAVSTALALSTGRDVKLMAAFVLARSGDSARALTLVKELKESYPKDTLMRLYWLPTINAAVDLNKRNYTSALKHLRAVEPYELGGAGTFINYLYPAYLRGQTYLQSGRADVAAAEFQKLLDHPGIVANFVTGALVHLQCGRAYVMAGEITKARVAYARFLELWKDADPGIGILIQAKTEYSRLMH
jgi:eukaryotic-like serine/threonine-protein kinase